MAARRSQAPRRPTAVDAIANLPLFAGEAASLVATVALHARVVHRRAGATLVAQGEIADAVYGVVAGQLRVEVQQRDGRTSMLSVLGAGELVGELGVLGAVPRTAHVVALDDVVAVRIPGASFLDAVRVSASLGLALSRSLAVRVRRLGEQQAQLTTLEAKERLAHRMLFLAERFGRNEAVGLVIDVRLAQSDLAELSGLSRQHVNRVMRILAKDEVVVSRAGHIIVRDLARLRAVAHRRP